MTATAVIARKYASSFTADSWLSTSGKIYGTLTANAIIKRAGLSGSFTANAWLSRRYSGSFTANAKLQASPANLRRGTFSLNAFLSDGTPLEPSRIVKISSPGSVSDAFLAALTLPKMIRCTWTSSTVALGRSSSLLPKTSMRHRHRRRLARYARTAQLRIVNDAGRYTRLSSTTRSSSIGSSRLLRLRYLDSRGGETEYVLLGTFAVDRPEVFVERNMSVLTVDCSDRWKMIATGGFATGASYAIGVDINTIIHDIAIVSGLADDDLNLDPLTDRAVSLKTIGTRVEWEIGDDRSAKLLDLCEQFALQVFFDPAGFLTTREIPEPATTTPVWTFVAGEDAVMLGITKAQNDLRLINHIIVSGESSGDLHGRSGRAQGYERVQSDLYRSDWGPRLSLQSTTRLLDGSGSDRRRPSISEVRSD
jgi:hypothetical protein